MAGKKISELTEVLTVDVENDYVVIARDGDNKKLKVANMMGSTNVGENYVDLKAYDDDEEYRLIINNDGKVQVFPKESVEGHVYDPGDNFKIPLRSDYVVVGAMGATTAVGDANTKVVDGHGIIINQAYGGGEIEPTTTSQGCAVSHSFVELYNCSNKNSVPLCGLYLHYKGNTDTAWKTLALRGEIPPRHSFLIRGKQHGNLFGDMIICKIYDYDQEWIDAETGEPIALASNGMSLYLSINPEAPGANENPKSYVDQKDASGNVTGTTYDQYYVDLLGAGSADGVNNPSAYNAFYHNCMNVDTAIRRINFRNNKNNLYDAGPINYREHDNIEAVKPRSLRDGIWEQPADKIQPKENVPNLVNITFGKQATTRFFTWQSSVTDRGAVRLRRIKDGSGSALVEAWMEVESERELVNNHGLFMTIHRAKVENLEAGLYEYKVGEPGYWSDEEMLNVKVMDNDAEIRMLWTTDQQGFTELEYKAWNTCVKGMKDQPGFYDENGLPNFDFHLNTGDISQNASNLYEWLYYNVYADEFCRNIPHMITCGNNDLVDKKYGFAFEHYSTYEDIPMLNDHHKEKLATKDQPMVSTYSFDLGHTHFVCLNSNSEEMYGDYGVDKTEFLLKQAYFLDKDLYEVSQREEAEKPHWVIVYAHLSPFTVTRAKRLQHWIPILEHYGVDAFLCGHNHTYSRSIPIKCGYNGSTKETDYNTYVTTASTYTAVDELKADGTEIDRSAHPADGTYYLMFQAAGAKMSGKEKALDLSTSVYSGLEEKHKDSSATGTRPWWYGFDGEALPVQPCYAIMNATADTLSFSMNYIDKIVANNKETGVQTIADYDPAVNVSKEFDTLTINYADRTPAYRTGVDTPYYDENK